ncbi:uncharacterized protein LOC135486689 [Lineus longissimus]|uniref:uncharacterized protein LOC135486689 n=1 Tax=Lineus longissimus TaxID=88925 RepID=UPI002B4F5FE7
MRRGSDIKTAPPSLKVQKGNTNNSRKTNAGAAFEPLGGWDAEDDVEDLSITDWATEKYETHTPNHAENVTAKPRSESQSRLWEKFLCVPSLKCTGIKNIDDFKDNSLSELILKENEEKTKPNDEKKVKVKEDDERCYGCQNNRTGLTRAVTQVNLRPPNQTLPNRAKSSNNLSLRSRSKLGLVYRKYADEDEDQDVVRKNTSGNFFQPSVKFSANSSSTSTTQQENPSRTQSSVSFNIIQESPEGKRQREIKSAHALRSVQVISPAVKLCYTNGVDPSRTNGSVAGHFLRSKTMSVINGDTSQRYGMESEKTYDRCKSTSSDNSSQDKTFVTNLKSKFTKGNQLRSKNKPNDSQNDFSGMSRNNSVKKHMSKLAKRQEQAQADANGESDIAPLTMVLRKYSNESETDIDARLKRVQDLESKLKLAHPNGLKLEQQCGVKTVDPVKGDISHLVINGVKDSVTVRFLEADEEDYEEDAEDQGKEAIFPIGEMLPDDAIGAPPNSVRFDPDQRASTDIDRDMKVTGRDLLVHHEDSLILLREGIDGIGIKDKYGHQAHLGPPAFRPMSQKTILHRAKESTQKRMNGKSHLHLPLEVENTTAFLRVRMPKLSNFSRESKRVQSAAQNEAGKGLVGRLSRRRRTFGEQAQDRTTMIDFQHARAKLQMGLGDVLRRYQHQEDV